MFMPAYAEYERSVNEPKGEFLDRREKEIINPRAPHFLEDKV